MERFVPAGIASVYVAVAVGESIPVGGVREVHTPPMLTWMEPYQPFEFGDDAGVGAVPLNPNEATTFNVVATVVVIAGKFRKLH